MALWIREKLLKQKDEIIDWYKQKEQECRTDLEQKERLIRELEQKKAEFERLLEQKQAEYNTSLKQKEEVWNRRLQAASSFQTPKPVPHPQHHPSQFQNRASNTTQSASSHFQMMQRLARQMQSSPQPSSFYQLQTSRQQTPPGTVIFNPLKYQGRG